MEDLPKILITTRFSFFGLSGWKSEFSTNPDYLFDENRLLQRFWLFEHITLRSLASQTDKDFHYFVLSSNMMPKWAQNKLEQLCRTYVGAGRYTIRFARPAPARRYQRLMQVELAGDGLVTQVVLDDDDALSNDFVETLRIQISEFDFSNEEMFPHFLTFPFGYVLGLREDNTCVWTHGYKFINLGLTLIGSRHQKNIFAINHRNAPKIYGFTTQYDKPMYVRTLSNVNDSHVVVKDKWKEIEDWQTNEDISLRFPFMRISTFEDYHQLAKPKHDDPLSYTAEAAE